MAWEPSAIEKPVVQFLAEPLGTPLGTLARSSFATRVMGRLGGTGWLGLLLFGGLVLIGLELGMPVCRTGWRSALPTASKPHLLLDERRRAPLHHG